MLAVNACTVIVLANHKGGCAKTTSVANLGVAFAQLGLSVLLVDADPQGNLGEVFGVEPEHPGPRLQHALAEPSGRNLMRPWSTRPASDGEPLPLPGGVHLLPGGDGLERAVSARTAEHAFAFRLAELVDALRPAYDVVLIDTPPGLGPLSSMAMLAADWVIAPARPADFDVGGAVKLAELIEHRLRLARPQLRLLGVLVTQVDQRWKLADDTRAALKEAGIAKLVTEIPFRVRVGAAPRHGVPTLLVEPDSAVSVAYRQLAQDLVGAILPPPRGDG